MQILVRGILIDKNFCNKPDKSLNLQVSNKKYGDSSWLLFNGSVLISISTLWLVRGYWRNEIGTCKSCSKFYCIVLLCSGRCNQVWKKTKAIFSWAEETTYLPLNHLGNTDLLFIRNGCVPLNSNSVYVMPNPNLYISIFTTGYTHTSNILIYWDDHMFCSTRTCSLLDPKIFIQVRFLNLYKYAGFDYLFLPKASTHLNGT